MIKYLYTFVIYLYKLTIGFLSIFNKKAKLKFEGIQNTRSIIANLKLNLHRDLVFIHCSSQGEHEQAKPLIRWIITNTKFDIFITFFSPSGYVNADIIDVERITKAYLPFDTPKDISIFVESVNPKLAIIIKNEWWWNLILTLKQHNIPTFLVSATFRKSHYFITYPNSFFTSGLRSFSKIFVVDLKSKEIIGQQLNSSIIVSGDTRIDQVNYLKNQVQSQCSFNDIKKDPNEVIVYGSIWPSDLDCLSQMILSYPNAIHIIYPHELNSKNINFLSYKIPRAKVLPHTKNVIDGVNIITTMGELKYAYRLASLAYVGGGFGEGIHNVLEAACYNIPTLFGPNYTKSNEAIELVKQKSAFTFTHVEDLKYILVYIAKEKNRKEIESKLKAYFSPRLSPTEIICKEIFLKNNLHV